MKRKVDYSEMQWPSFNDHMKEVVLQQRDEVIRTLSGRGKYRLCGAYEHLQVSPQEWAKMTPNQRKRHIKKFDDAAQASLRPSSSSRTASSCSILSSEPSSSNTTPANEKFLSVLCEDSGIENIPFATLHSIWVKAEEYLNSSSDVVAAPGEDKKARMVTSKSNVTPHFVRCLSSGQYVCDNSCMQWKSSNLCSHVIAVAELNGELGVFLQWYKATNQQPNITSLAMINLPAGRGRKGGIPKRKGRNVQSAVPEVFIPRPGTCKKTLSSQQGHIITGGRPRSEQACTSDPQAMIASPLPQQPVIYPPVSQMAISSSNPVLAQMVSCNVGPLVNPTVSVSQAATIAPNTFCSQDRRKYQGMPRLSDIFA